MVLETVAIDTLASAATARISGVLSADFRVPLRATKQSLKLKFVQMKTELHHNSNINPDISTGTCRALADPTLRILFRHQQS